MSVRREHSVYLISRHRIYEGDEGDRSYAAFGQHEPPPPTHSSNQVSEVPILDGRYSENGPRPVAAPVKILHLAFATFAGYATGQTLSVSEDMMKRTAEFMLSQAKIGTADYQHTDTRTHLSELLAAAAAARSVHKKRTSSGHIITYALTSNRINRFHSPLLRRRVSLARAESHPSRVCFPTSSIGLPVTERYAASDVWSFQTFDDTSYRYPEALHGVCLSVLRCVFFRPLTGCLRRPLHHFPNRASPSRLRLDGMQSCHRRCACSSRRSHVLRPSPCHQKLGRILRSI